MRESRLREVDPLDAAAAMLADVTRTNIFMGRLNQGFHASLLGEHVDLEAQRALRRLRNDAGAKTQLIVASMREWQTYEDHLGIADDVIRTIGRERLAT